MRHGRSRATILQVIIIERLPLLLIGFILSDFGSKFAFEASLILTARTRVGGNAISHSMPD